MKKFWMQEGLEAKTDEEIIGYIREGRSELNEYLMERYKELVRKKASSMYILGAEREDLIQEGMIGLFKAIRDYDFGRDASFATFADLCVLRQMYTAIESMNRKKNIPLNNYVSLFEDPISDIEDTNMTPEDEVISRENAVHIQEKIEKILSPFERKAFELWITGMTSTQIAAILSKDSKSTDNALTRAKNKLRKSF